MEKKNAILMAISDNYSFAAANVMLSIRDNSPRIFNECDFLIYHNGICEENRRALLRIKANTKFILKDDWLPPNVREFCGINQIFCFIRLECFKLIETYKKILWLDTDTYVSKPLDYLFEADYDVAFRPTINWEGRDIYPHLLKDPADMPLGVHGGVVAFSDRLERYHITRKTMEELGERFVNVSPRWNMDEKFLSYLIYYYDMNILKLPLEWNVWVGYPNIQEAVVQHFIGDEKPWKQPFVFRAFPRWAVNYYKFIEYGGVNYPDIDRSESFFNNHYTFWTAWSVQKYPQIIKDLAILKDPDINFDFNFNAQKMRFNFKHLENILYIEFLSRFDCQISFVMEKPLFCERNNELFDRLCGFLKTKFKKVRELSTSASRSVVIYYNEPGMTDGMMQEFVSSVKSEFYRDMSLEDASRSHAANE